jgi:hypothetical protein
MIHIRKAIRIATLTISSIAIAYFGLNQVHGELASILVIYASFEIPFSHWASVWPAPQDEWPARARD